MSKRMNWYVHSVVYELVDVDVYRSICAVVYWDVYWDVCWDAKDADFDPLNGSGYQAANEAARIDPNCSVLQDFLLNVGI
jgi:hypothetical protein